MTVRIAMIGTSWWSDAMYLPALRALPDVEIVGVAGRHPERTQDFADRWEIPHALTDTEALFDLPLDAVIVASANDSHHPLTMAALERGFDVMCEKPLGLTSAEAAEMAASAQQHDAITMVPFTYRYMPVNGWVKQLISDGYLGLPHHLGLRYFTGFARDGEYAWRFDISESGSGVIGDLGSHWLDLARWFLGEIESVGATTSHFIDREDRPDGRPYERGEDSAVITARFVSGAYAVLQVSAVCWEGTEFNQTHHLDAHGSDGTLYATTDWETVQEVRGVKAGAPGPAVTLPIPDQVWGGARRDTVHNTYRDVFRGGGAMIGDFVASVRTREPVTPDFADGLRIQQLGDAALASVAANGAQIRV